MTRTMAIVLAMGLLSGCDIGAATQLHPAAQQELSTALDASAVSDDDEPPESLKYPERPPCKVCITGRVAPHQGQGW